MTAPHHEQQIRMAHGGGGELMHQLLNGVIRPALGLTASMHDGAVVDEQWVMTTDAFVVQPLTFAGGDIGRLAVCGTVNDLAVSGAVPVALSLAVIVEEGFDMAQFRSILDSVATACDEAGVSVVTGDTKVIERRGESGLQLVSTGVGRAGSWRVHLDEAVSDDVLIINGPIGEHGLAVMAARQGLGLQTDIVSDVAPLSSLIRQVLTTGANVKFMRDPTRAGVAGVLVDIAEGSGMTVEVDESAIPMTAGCRHLAELLGLDLLQVANEGKCLFVVAESDAEQVLAACRAHPLGERSAVIGRLVDRAPALVELLCRHGGRRVIDRPYGDQLPRIC